MDGPCGAPCSTFVAKFKNCNVCDRVSELNFFLKLHDYGWTLVLPRNESSDNAEVAIPTSEQLRRHLVAATKPNPVANLQSIRHAGNYSSIGNSLGMSAIAATRSPNVSIERRSSRQLRTGQSIQADALLGSHECQIAMDQRWDAHTELAAIVLLGQRYRNGFAARLHVGHAPATTFWMPVSAAAGVLANQGYLHAGRQAKES